MIPVGIEWASRLTRDRVSDLLGLPPIKDLIGTSWPIAVRTACCPVVGIER
jgi:hypothetical protein